MEIPSPDMKESSIKTEETKVTQKVRVLIQNEQVGTIIGKGGNNVKRIHEETGASLSILKAEHSNVPVRVMTIRGTIKEITDAVRCICTIIADAKALMREKSIHPIDTSYSITFLCHRLAVGAIIGKAGGTIRDTQEETGAHIQISHESLPGSTEKTVEITGSIPGICAATFKVLTQLQTNPLKKSVKTYLFVPGQPVIFQTPFGIPAIPYAQQALTVTYPTQSQATMTQPGRSSPQYTQQPQNITIQTISPAPSVTTSYEVFQDAVTLQKVSIPTHCAGVIIGKGGSVIRALRAQTGCNISIAQPELARPHERIISVTGSVQGINLAIHLIRQLVEQYIPLAPSVPQGATLVSWE